ncbi:MAG TPA: phosphodiester glycosidase family protein [Acidimicrobiales bacterium]|nr:phosphodiester glycosidase family protein [Acidimicrobiales bacterium]
MLEIAAGAAVVVKAVPASPSGGAGTATVATLCARAGSMACVNGDFFSASRPLGGEMVDGRWIKAPTRVQQQLWLNSANHFSIGAQPTGALQSLGATSYAILQPGQPIAIPEHDSFADGRFARTLIGWDGAGNSFLVTVEQGAGSTGMSLAEAAALMRQLGATTAVNEDGGGSSQMVVGGSRLAAAGEAARAVANSWAVVAAPAAPAAVPAARTSAAVPASGASAAVQGPGASSDGFPSRWSMRPAP